MTFVLVWMGGLVTSNRAGLAVPDWPNTYGYNMFFFPPSKWIGGIFSSTATGWSPRRSVCSP